MQEDGKCEDDYSHKCANLSEKSGSIPRHYSKKRSHSDKKSLSQAEVSSSGNSMDKKQMAGHTRHSGVSLSGDKAQPLPRVSVQQFLLHS